MATIGSGYRTVLDLLIEVSYQLVEPIVQTTLTESITAGTQTVTVGSATSMYPGAQLVVDFNTASQEVITLTGVSGDSITATFTQPHAAGAVLLGATFPTQQATDPLYTQTEMLGYLSRAQNEFLSKVPVIYALFFQSATYGEIFQDTPNTAMEIQRIASSTFYSTVVSATRTGNLVTVMTSDPHGLGAGSTPFFSGALDASFDGTFAIVSVPSPTTLTYNQRGEDATTTGGQLLYWLRLYEYTQAELTQQYRQWQNAYIGSPNAWFEDRTGLYRFGLNGKPASNFPLEMLCSIRDSDSLGMGDSFLVPDPMLHYVKYLMLAYIFSKDGVQSDPQRVGYCQQRYEKGLLTCQRYISGMVMGMSK